MLVKGENLGQLYSNAAFGLADVLKPEDVTYPAEFPLKRRIALSSIDSTSLLIDFLSEILYLSHKEKALYPGVIVREMGELELDAYVLGFHADRFGEDVKAVTYHEAEIIGSEGNFECVVILDI